MGLQCAHTDVQVSVRGRRASNCTVERKDAVGDLLIGLTAETRGKKSKLTHISNTSTR